MTLSYYPEFITSTILNWQHLLADDRLKQTVADSLHWLTQEKRCKVYAFVIMPNHVHLLWKIEANFQRKDVQGTLFSFTGHQFKKYLQLHNPLLLQKHYVNDADRSYQFWEREPLVKECRKDKFFMQKINYIHNNPCQPKWSLADLPENYLWSSAAFYESGNNDFPWLSNYMER